MANFRTFGTKKGDVLVNLDHIVSIDKTNPDESQVNLSTGLSFVTNVALNHIRAELDPKFIVPPG